MKHLISINDISKEDMLSLFHCARMKDKIFEEYSNKLKNKILASIFLQPSTRTQLSFQSAFIKLGGQFIGFSDINSTRSGPPYYEPLDDMAQIVSNYCDIIVMRTINDTYTKDYLKGAKVPIISAGSGNIEHPTQALTDLFTLTTYYGNNLSGLNILLIGTPRQRTINSFLLGLSKWENINVHIICQPGVLLPEFVSQQISSNLNINYYSSSNNFFELNNGKSIDVIYMDKIFKETTEYNEMGFSKNQLYTEFRKDVIIMHPLPRTQELPQSFDIHPGAIYFNQARNGLYIRAALFLMLL